LYLVLAAAALFALGYVFYRNILVSFVFMLLAIKYPGMRQKEIAQERQRQLTLQFKDMLYSLSSAVGAGSSVENAVSIALEDMKQQYGDPNTMIIRELELMRSRLSFGQNIEDVFDDFGKRSHIEDVQTFANIFDISKRTGGDIVKIIRQTTDVISQKIETKNEIETSLSGRKMEQKVLTVMPIVLVLCLTYLTGGFMDVIFTTWKGRLIATIGLALVMIGSLWSKKITDIRV
jgi:tight adherence protein B